MVQIPSTISIDLPADATELRRLARWLERERHWRALAVVLGVMSAQDPSNWRLALRHACLLDDDDDMVSAHAILARLFAENGRVRSTSLRAALDHLATSNRPRLLAQAVRVLAELRPDAWRLRWEGAASLAKLGDAESAANAFREIFASPAVSGAARKALFAEMVETGDPGLVAAAIAGHGAVDHKGLVALLSGWRERASLPCLRDALRAPGVDERGTLLLALAKAMESLSEADMADEALECVQPMLAQEPSPSEPTPTASTMMFRNMPLLTQLLAICAWIVERKECVRIHVGACSSGEEAYSLALLLQQRGLLGSCEIRGTDVDRALVRRARTGVLEARAVSAIPENLGTLDLVRRQDLRWQLGRDVLERIRFDVEDLSRPRGEKRYDMMLANNVLIHLPLAEKQRMLRCLVNRVEPDGVLCIGGSRQEPLEPTLAELGLVALERGSAEVFDAWAIQRNAWYLNPRPYWALPPARHSSSEPWRHATLFARSRESADALERVLAGRGP